MKLSLFLILLLTLIYAADAVVVSDDFTRDDNQNISERYFGDISWFEVPENHVGSIPYTGMNGVYIENNSLIIQGMNSCGMVTVVGDFGKAGSLQTYDDGNISFYWANWAVGSNNRWFNSVIFGENLSKKQTIDWPCEGETNYWDINAEDSFSKFGTRLSIDGTLPENVIGIGCTQLNVLLDGSRDGIFHYYTLSFDTNNDRFKVWIDESYMGEFSFCYGTAEKINSVGITVHNNQALSTTPYSKLDNLVINFNKDEDVEPEVNPLLEKYAPVFYLYPSETYEPRPVESMLINANLMKSTLVEAKPLTKENISDLDDSRAHYLDLTNVDMTDGDDLPPPADFMQDSKIYGRYYVDDNDYKHLQYFIFYPFQDWYVMEHEGDWQMMQVTLNDINETESVTYSFNNFDYAIYSPDFPGVDFVNETHPVVYVGRGSHNNFANDGAISLFGYWPIELAWVNNLMSEFKKVDKISKDGNVYSPGDFSLPKQHIYEIEQISTNTPWINYEGQWGEKTLSLINNAPRGPKWGQFYRRWRSPEDWSYSPDLPFISAFLYSPLDITIFDENNNPVEYDFYTGADEEPEAVVASGLRNYTLRLDATGEGQFTLKVFYYDNATDNGIMVKYSNISNNANTKAILDVSRDSYFILYVDLDGDGVYELHYLPDEVILYRNFEYTVPDMDKDGIIDLFDNCIENKNENQADFNNNGLGDACDNPRYYKEMAWNMVKDAQKDKPKDRLLNLAKQEIKASLKDKLWIDDFTPSCPVVFVYELIAAKYLRGYPEIQEKLALADKLIIEMKLIKKPIGRVQILYNNGNSAYSEKRYVEAILYYMQAGWGT